VSHDYNGRMTRTRSLMLFAALAVGAALAGACGNLPSQQSSQGAPVAVGASGGSSGGGSGTFEIVFLGDSLTSGLGLTSEEAFPALVQGEFAAEGYNVEVVNAGISGDTSAGGLRRVGSALTADTRILVVALGGNDALRGLTATQTHDNLAGIIDAALAHNSAVLVAGIQPPTNLGEDYRGAFNDIFPRLLSEYRGRIALMPFLLDGVAGVPSLNQADGIHPNADGAKIIAEALYPRLRTIVDSLGGGH